jgi:hypothetical protein
MTRTMHAWRKANACIRAGNHRKAVYWLCRTQEILDGGPPERGRGGLASTCMLSGLGLLFIIWIAMS